MCTTKPKKKCARWVKHRLTQDWTSLTYLCCPCRHIQNHTTSEPQGGTVPVQASSVVNNASGYRKSPPLRSKRSNFSLLSPPQVCKGFEPGLGLLSALGLGRQTGTMVDAWPFAQNGLHISILRLPWPTTGLKFFWPSAIRKGYVLLQWSLWDCWADQNFPPENSWNIPRNRSPRCQKVTLRSFTECAGTIVPGRGSLTSTVNLP